MPESSLPYHAQSSDEVLSLLDVTVDQGLSKNEVEERRKQHGRNELQHARRRNVWRILLEQFKSVVILILLVAGVAALITAQWTEAIAIALVVMLSASRPFPKA